MMVRAEGRTDRDGRNGDAGVAGHDVSRGTAGETERACSHFGEDAEAFHPDRAGRQSGGGAFTLRSDQGADHISGKINREGNRGLRGFESPAVAAHPLRRGWEEGNFGESLARSNSNPSYPRYPRLNFSAIGPIQRTSKRS